MATAPEPAGMRYAGWYLAGGALVLCLFLVWRFTRSPEEPGKSADPYANLPLGERIYRANCAGCHGDTGRGDGSAGGRFIPPPTDFARGPWKKGDTPEAIRRSIVEGVPPAMVPVRTLNEDELSALVDHVRTLAKKP